MGNYVSLTFSLIEQKCQNNHHCSPNVVTFLFLRVQNVVIQGKYLGVKAAAHPESCTCKPLMLFWAKRKNAKVVLSRLTGLGDMGLMDRCWLDLHLELHPWKRCSAVGGCPQESRRRKENTPTSSPYLCPCRDFSWGQIAAWSSLNGFRTMIVTEWGHGWYKRWMWTDIPIHSTHQPVALRMSHLAVEQK